MTALALIVTLSALAQPPRTREAVIDGASADAVLKRGDVLVKFLGPNTPITATEKITMEGQEVFQRFSGDIDLKKGDPRCFHVAIYLGGGKTAEANGGDVTTACVGPFTIDDHAGYVFQVFRPADARLADAAAKVAETWANPRRMKYLVPAVVVKNASFGPLARIEALTYGKAADMAGGPPDVKKMFCSEFVLASYQAAFVKELLAKNPSLQAVDVTAPYGINLQASHSSPFAFQSHLTAAVAKGLWQKAGAVLVKAK